MKRRRRVAVPETADDIVGDLARKPLHCGDRCAFCEVRVRWLDEVTDHKPTCLFRRAVEWGEGENDG